jgi:hypothetical protein
MSLNTLSGPDSRDLSVRDPAGRIRVSAWFCQTLSEVPACYLGITRGRVRTFYLPVLPLYGFTKLYTNPFLIIYLLPNFKLPVLVLFWGLEQKKTKFGFPHRDSRNLAPTPHPMSPDCQGLFTHEILDLARFVSSTPGRCPNEISAAHCTGSMGSVVA